MTSKKLLFALTAAITAVLFLLSNAYASENTFLTQAYINEKNLDMFMSGSFDKERLSVKAANREADVIDCGTISDKEISVCTTVLVDISTSMPAAAREKVIEFINLKIKNLAKNEQLRIIAFGSEIKMLQDFTSDRYDLNSAAENIKFDGTQSVIYDAIYNTIPDIKLFNDMPCFYRTIVLTDGADYALHGVTKEELLIKLQAQTYPLDVICVNAAQPDAQNKDLSALARISNGKYFDLYPETDVARLASDISASDFFWVRVEIPVEMLDGSTRQIDISDGTNNTSFDMKMSVVDIPTEKTATVSELSSDPQPASYSSSETSIDSTASNDNDDQGLPINTLLLIVMINVGVIAAAATVIVIIVYKNKKKAHQTQTIQHSYPIANSSVKIGETEIVEECDGKEHYSIKISNTANQNDSWILDVFSDIIIGRAESCAVRIDEKSVSREQCKIAANKNGLAISNLSASNKTKLNGTVLVTEVMLHPADNIHFGRVTLRVDHIQKVTDDVPPQTPYPNSSGIGTTKSIF